MSLRLRSGRLLGCLVSALFVACQSPVLRAPAAPAGAEGSVLPLARVRLFENGIGYFERSGTLTATAALLPVPASHVDDALKTLVVLSNSSMTVSGIEFASLVSGGTARALAGLPLSDETPLGYGDVLSSLEGYRVRLTTKSGAQFSGRLIDVQRFERAAATCQPRAPNAVQAPEGAETRAAIHESEAPNAPTGSVEDHWLFVVSDVGSLRRIPASETT
ncbi:MAG TPA: hypothetical protein VFQ61_11635, partial [Polyangiaceae bacterium]|nr:hypothetical protein [Polyangiaceae bacterium]